MAGMVWDEAAYEAGVRRRILQNARKTQPRKLAEFTEAYPEVVRFLMEGRFGQGSFAELLFNFRDQLMNFGRLSAKQAAVVQKAIARREEARKAAQARAAHDAETSQWVGSVGDRKTFTVKVVRVFTIETAYGLMTINILMDDSGNVLVYRGHKWGTNEVLTVRARIKEHSEYQGVKQTILTRPTVL